MSDKKRDGVIDNQGGFVLVLAMLIMVVLIVIGISSIKTSRVELEIAGNEKFHQQAFYEAEAGISTGIEVLEENIACPKGFDATESDNATAILAPQNIVAVSTLNFYLNDTDDLPPTGGDRDIYYPQDSPDVRTDIKMGGITKHSEGSALQMVAGYEGVGKSAAGGGSAIYYDIYSKRFGHRNCESCVLVEWRHIIGQEDNTCNY